MNHLCRNCGYTGPSMRIVPGSNALGIVLLLVFILPGLIYAVWQQINSGPGCPQCKRINALIPIDSPRAKEILAARASGAPASSGAMEAPIVMVPRTVSATGGSGIFLVGAFGAVAVIVAFFILIAYLTRPPKPQERATEIARVPRNATFPPPAPTPAVQLVAEPQTTPAPAPIVAHWVQPTLLPTPEQVRAWRKARVEREAALFYIDSVAAMYHTHDCPDANPKTMSLGVEQSASLKGYAPHSCVIAARAAATAQQ
jgi:hypothetical protein